MSIPPREFFAAATRKAIEDHDEWDSPHWFMPLHWEDGKLSPHIVACIMPDIAPTDYPAHMIRIAREDYEKDPDSAAYAYLLQIEAFGTTEPGPEASDEERAQYLADRLGRTFHQRADAVEMATAWCADIHGRLWEATKRRNQPGVITEHFYAPGALNRPGGQMIRGLLTVAQGTGMIAYGLPGPSWVAN